MFKKYLLNTQQFVKKQLLLIVMVLLLLTPLVTILISRYTNTQNENRNALAAEPTPTQAVVLPLIFKDSTNGTMLSLEVLPGSSNPGKFEFFVPNVGNYRGTIPLLQNGKQIIHPQGQISGQFFPPQGGSPVATTIKMEGEIDISHNTATINVWIDGSKYHLQTATVDTAQATAVANQVVSYSNNHDWASLYSLFSSEFKADATQTQFTQFMSDSNSPTITDVKLNGNGSAKVFSGITYFRQPLTLTERQTDGTFTTLYSNMYFVLEDGSWKLLTTDTPKQ